MLNIFICDDEQHFVTSIKQTVEAYLTNNPFVMGITLATTQPNEILTHLQDNPGIMGLYFLDLHMPGELNGMQLATEIRKYDARGFIIFVTSDTQSHKMAFTYMAEAMHYIVKDDTDWKQSVHQCIDKVIERMKTRSNGLKDNSVVKLAKETKWKNNRLDKHNELCVDNDDILYITTNPYVKHNILVYTTDSVLEQRGSLLAWEAQLNDRTRFFRCHNSYIINMDKVIDLYADDSHGKVLFGDNKAIELPVRKIKRLRKHMRTYKMSIGDK